jgi:soluble lytic murein transglycosylase-like protein
MLQKFIRVPALAAVLVLLTAGLFVQKPELGLAPNQPQQISTRITDPTSAELFEASSSQKMASALAAIARQKKIAEARTRAKAGSQKTASITIQKVGVPADVEAKIRQYANVYGANPEVMIVIARCESGFRADAISASGAYKGMYQFVTSTWQSNRRAMGLPDDPALMFNAEEAIKTAAFKMGRDGYGAWPVCSQKAFASLALN